jgi:hypothetical protein
MKINMADWDRILRLISGVMLLIWGVAGGPWWAYFGLVLIATGAWRFCPIYALFRNGTARGQRNPS